MFAICVNGERVWAKGVNWIPDDPFPHRVTKEQYELRIRDLYSVEVNAIRIWGGGIYESDHFYDLCDELGIIVWQDFLFACASYPETTAMFAEVEEEAHQAITRLSTHASLVMWCGGNECIEGFQHWGWKEPLAGKAWGSTFYMDTLPRALTKFDGSRPYIPSSPFSTLKEDVKDFSSGTNHIWDVWNETGYQRYEEYSPSFSAEFGYNGPGSWRTLTKSIGKTTLDSRDPDVATHQKAFFGLNKVANGLVREFDKELIEGHSWYFAAQLVQALAPAAEKEPALQFPHTVEVPAPTVADEVPAAQAAQTLEPAKENNPAKQVTQAADMVCAVFAEAVPATQSTQPPVPCVVW
jgi:beta-mannosidase